MQRRNQATGLLRGSVHSQDSVDPGCRRGTCKIAITHHLDGIQVAHEDHRRGRIALAELAHHLQHAVQGDVVPKRPFAGPLNDRAVGHGIRKGHTELDDVGACGCHGAHQRNREIRPGVAGGDKRNKRRATGSAQPFEAGRDPAHSSIPSRAATVWMSLSPRPDRFTTISRSRSMPGASLAA